MEGNLNRIVCGDKIYGVDVPYRAGAISRRNHPTKPNPHAACDPKHDSWQDGWNNEAVREHVRFGVDVACAAHFFNVTFRADTQIPRDAEGNVSLPWYVAAITAAKKGQSIDDFMRQYGFEVFEVSSDRGIRLAIRLEGDPSYASPHFADRAGMCRFVCDHAIRLRRDGETAVNAPYVPIEKEIQSRPYMMR